MSIITFNAFQNDEQKSFSRLSRVCFLYKSNSIYKKRNKSEIRIKILNEYHIECLIEHELLSFDYISKLYFPYIVKCPYITSKNKKFFYC